MKYQVTIKNNETGEIVHEADTDCIIFAAHGEEKTDAGFMACCDSIATYSAYKGVKEILQKVEENPKIQKLAKLEEILKPEAEGINEETPES